MMEEAPPRPEFTVFALPKKNASPSELMEYAKRAHKYITYYDA